jgi:hypothetical protein
LAVVAPEVGPAGLGRIQTLARVLEDSSTADLIRLALTFTRSVSLDVLDGLLGVTCNIEGVARSFRDGETEVESNAARHSTEADDDTPHLVHSKLAHTVAKVDRLGGLEGVFETRDDDQSNDGGGELANTLHGEDGTHHGTSPLGGGESGIAVSMMYRCLSRSERTPR